MRSFLKKKSTNGLAGQRSKEQINQLHTYVALKLFFIEECFENKYGRINSMRWKGIKVLVTGGASFIGSHIVDSLVLFGAQVRVVDDLSSGKLDNIRSHLNKKAIEFIHADLLKKNVVKKSVKTIDYIFHLAAIHGGRGYVDMHQAAVTANILLDTQLIQEAYLAKVKKFIFASSGCVYPNYIQRNTKEKLFLKESLVGPPYDPDNMYGWAKLTTEKILGAYYKDYGFKSVSCRFFTAFGPRGVENNASIALIARAFIRQNPYEVWGDGQQIRNWTYVDDIVSGMIKAAEHIDNGRAINIGTTTRTSVAEAVQEIFDYTQFHPTVLYKRTMPTGPVNRVCNNKLSRQVLGWEPKIKFREGLHKTIHWYFSTHNKLKVKKTLPYLLTER